MQFEAVVITVSLAFDSSISLVEMWKNKPNRNTVAEEDCLEFKNRYENRVSSSTIKFSEV